MKHALADTVVMLAELKIKVDQREAFLDYTVENLKTCRSYPGNISFEMLVDEARPERVYFYEVWESQGAQQRYMAWRVEVGDLARLLSFLDGPPKFDALRSVVSPG